MEQSWNKIVVSLPKAVGHNASVIASAVWTPRLWCHLWAPRLPGRARWGWCANEKKRSPPHKSNTSAERCWRQSQQGQDGQECKDPHNFVSFYIIIIWTHMISMNICTHVCSSGVCGKKHLLADFSRRTPPHAVTLCHMLPQCNMQLTPANEAKRKSLIPWFGMVCEEIGARTINDLCVFAEHHDSVRWLIGAFAPAHSL